MMRKTIFSLFLLLLSALEIYAATCPIKYIGEHKVKDGIIIAPINFKVVGQSCTETYRYHLDANSIYKTVKQNIQSYVYISGKKIEVSDNYTLVEKYIGTKADLLNAIQQSVIDFYTLRNTSISWLNESYFPSLLEAFESIDYGNPINDLFMEVSVPGVQNYAQSINNTKIGNLSINVEFYPESSAKAYLFYNITIEGDFVLDPSIHQGKIRFYGTNYTISVVNISRKVSVGNETKTIVNQSLEIMAKDFSKEIILDSPVQIKFSPIIIKYNTSYVENGTIINETKTFTIYNITVSNGKQTFWIVAYNISVSFVKEIHWQNVFYLLDQWGLVEAEITRVTNAFGEVTCNKCKEYVFTKEGRYYLTYDGNPKINNLPVVIVKPNVVGEAHTTIYPEDKVEERNLFTLKAVGVGDHLIKIKIGSYEKEFIIPEGSELKGNIVLDFNNKVLKIKYFKDGAFIEEDKVEDLSMCLHKDCDILYEIWYDDGYGFNTYKPKLFAKNYIKIRWNALSHTIPKIVIHETQQFTIPITVSNQGSSTAKDVNVYDLKYNSTCIKLWVGDSINIPPGSSGVVYLHGKIKSLNCKSQDYKFSFKIYGWNTYIYPGDLVIPVSTITFPPAGSVLTNLVTFKIKDVNAEKCYIYIDGVKYTRPCNSTFVYNNYCSRSGICIINVSSDNSYFTYYSSNYTYNIPNLASKDLVSTYAPTTLYLEQGSVSNVYVAIQNTGKDTISCSMDVDTNLLIVKSIKQDNVSVINIPYNFKIPPGTTLHFLIRLQAVKSGMENAKIHIGCSGNRRIDVILPTVVYTKQQLAGTVETKSTDEKLSYLVMIGIAGLLLIL